MAVAWVYYPHTTSALNSTAKSDLSVWACFGFAS